MSLYAEEVMRERIWMFKILKYEILKTQAIE